VVEYGRSVFRFIHIGVNGCRGLAGGRVLRGWREREGGTGVMGVWALMCDGAVMNKTVE
jgi:hypothetical protein